MRRYWLRWSPQSPRRNANACCYERLSPFRVHTHTNTHIHTQTHAHTYMHLKNTQSLYPSFLLAVLRLVVGVALHREDEKERRFSIILCNNKKLRPLRPSGAPRAARPPSEVSGHRAHVQVEFAPSSF